MDEGYETLQSLHEYVCAFAIFTLFVFISLSRNHKSVWTCSVLQENKFIISSLCFTFKKVMINEYFPEGVDRCSRNKSDKGMDQI